MTQFDRTAALTGEIRARHESNLGFRVGGKVIERLVDVGATVAEGDLLASDDPSARLALDYFVYRASLAIGSLAASLEGLDAVVFTAGIGENAPVIRAAICQKARWLGIELDEAANAAVNAAGARLISTRASRVGVYVIPTDEERMIAHHTLDVLRKRCHR